MPDDLSCLDDEMDARITVAALAARFATAGVGFSAARLGCMLEAARSDHEKWLSDSDNPRLTFGEFCRQEMSTVLKLREL